MDRSIDRSKYVCSVIHYKEGCFITFIFSVLKELLWSLPLILRIPQPCRKLVETPLTSAAYQMFHLYQQGDGLIA